MSAKPFIYVFNVDDAELQNKDMQAKLAASVLRLRPFSSTRSSKPT